MIFLLMLSTSHAEDELDLYRLAKGSQSLDSTKIEMWYSGTITKHPVVILEQQT